MKWYVLKNVTRSDKNEIEAEIQVPRGSPWFSGHFPGDPILPGVAQIGMVKDVIRQARGQDLGVSGVRRVRFKQIIRPDDKLNLVAAPLKENTGAYSFRILVENEVVCSGVMMVEELKKRENNQYDDSN
jgi:3-hydroxymyristoyl/3-hydroxydecanoyl-(acyl carrier protein) dehydratase